MAFGLSIKIGADISGLNRGLDQGKTSLQKFGDSVSAPIARIAKLATAATAAAAAIGSVMVKQSMASIDAMGKLSDRVGGTTEAMQGLQHVANLTGVSQEAMGKALEQLNARLGEARRGVGTAAAALDRMGLSADALAQMDVDERMATIADRMRELGYSSDQAGDAMRQLGIRNGELVNLMLEGGDAIRAGRDEIESFGGALSRVEVKQVEAANDSFTRVGTAIRAVADRVAVRLAPILQAIAERFSDMAARSGGFQSALGTAFDFAAKAAGVVADAVGFLAALFERARDIGVSVANRIGEAFSWIGDRIRAMVNSLIRAVNRVAGLIPGVQRQIEEIDPGFIGRRFEDAAALAERAVELGMTRIRAVMGDDLPSENFERWLASVQEASRKAAEAAVAKMPRGGEVEGSEPEVDQRALERLQQRVEALRQATLTEMEIEREKHAANLETLNEAFANELLTTEEWHEALEAERQRHDEKMSDIDKKGWTEREKFAAMSLGRQAAQLSGELSGIFGAMSAHNDKMFRMSKIASAGNALVATLAGQAEALKLGWPLGPIAAAKIGAAGFGFISAIKGAGKGGATVGSAVTATMSQAALPAPQQPQPERLIQIESVNPGALISAESLAKAIEEMADDGRTRIVIA